MHTITENPSFLFRVSHDTVALTLNHDIIVP
jgi:hypothetical protein